MGRDDYDDTSYEQLDSEETLEYGGPADPLDEGYSPPEKPWAVDDWGTTERENREGEGLDRRLAREVADDGADEDGDGLGDAEDTDGELRDDQVGDRRSGRLVNEYYVADDERAEDDQPFAADVGIDGAAASAEEAAVHVVDDDEEG
jgi:Family of unknown function (DUF5709)